MPFALNRLPVSVGQCGKQAVMTPVSRLSLEVDANALRRFSIQVNKVPSRQVPKPSSQVLNDGALMCQIRFNETFSLLFYSVEWPGIGWAHCAWEHTLKACTSRYFYPRPLSTQRDIKTAEPEHSVP